MEKYEYKIYDCDVRNLNNDTLNEFGREGWELVAHNTVAIPIEEYGVSVWHYFFFRRPLVTTEESCHDDDGWTYDEWQEHKRKIIEVGRELREMLEQ